MNKMMFWLSLLCIISLSIGVSIMLHQYIFWGHIWDLDQTLHHEFFASGLFAFSVGIAICILIGKR